MSKFANANVPELVEQLSGEEAISLISGVGFWRTYAVERLGIPSIKVSDGPNGIRGNHFFMGTPAKALPCATALGATWDLELVGRAAAKMLADEAKLRGASVILAPTVNIQRSPLGGRSFESFSEDPFLSGHVAAAYISNVQKNGIGSCIKHFVGNDMENDRMAYDSVISPRALREIYLMPFMIAQKYAKPWAYMTAYNRVNGPHMSENAILQSVLRDEWKSDALIMSDWFGVYSISESINAGLDLEMPGDRRLREINPVERAIRSKKTTMKVVKKRAEKVVELVKKCAGGAPEVIDGDGMERTSEDTPESNQLLRDLSSSSIVLLKNTTSLLPLNLDNIKTLAIIGPNAKARLVSGGGSASLRASYFVTPHDGIVNAVRESGKDTKVVYHEGSQAYLTLPTLEHFFTTTSGGSTVGLTGSWHSHSSESTTDPYTLVQPPVKVQVIDETNMIFSNAPPSELTEKWSLHLKTYTRPLPYDVEFEFGLTVAGRAKLFVDGVEVIDNWKKQVRGEAFFGTGTVEERGTVKLRKGVSHEIFIDFCNIRGPAGDDSDNTVTLGGGALRIGGREVLDPEMGIKESVEIAKGADAVVVVVGLNGDWESEGYDRTSLKLPGMTDELVRRVSEANEKVVVVTQSGSAIEMPWASQVPSIVHAWYLGNSTGDAIADVLFGKVNPSGKLSLSFPKRLEDTPSYGSFFEGLDGKVRYKEDLYVGYKHYLHAKVEPLFAFGHGLSYTTFAYSSLQISEPSSSASVDNLTYTVSFTITNTGSVTGSEVVQIYVVFPSSTFTPIQLKGFTKLVDIQPGEERRGEVVLDKYAFSYWDEGLAGVPGKGKWKIEKGEYGLVVGASSVDKKLEGVVKIGREYEWNGL